MRRRDLIMGLGAVAVARPTVAGAQDAPRLRLGHTAALTRADTQYVALYQRLNELGYVEGRNFTDDFSQIDGLPEQFYAAARELVRREPDVIFAPGPEISLKAVVAATRTIPIVMLAIAYDPLALGYVTSLARPVGNVTGLVMQQIELTSKRLQLVKEAFPDTRSVVMLWDAISADQWRVAQNAAAGLDLRLEGIEFRDLPYDYDGAFAKQNAGVPRALIVAAGVQFFKDRQHIAELAAKHRMISVFWERELADAGGLISYGPSTAALYRRAADYIDRIARGAKPADLPIEQPTKFELVLNLKTAKAIGLAIPPMLLARADAVIE